MATTPLTSLLSESWNFFLKRIGVILASALLVGIIIAIIQIVFVSNVTPYAQKALNVPGFDMARIQELQRRAQQGDTTALQELQKETANAAANLPQNPQDMARTFLPGFLRIGSLALAMGIVVALISLVLNSFVLLLVLENSSASNTLKRTTALYLPLLGLMIIIGIVSFVWIPLLGIILGIIIVPRLILSPVILVKEKKGIIESVKQSWKRSSGYWGKIFGNLLAVGIVIWIIQLIAAALLGTFGLGMYVAPFISMLVTTFMVVFCAKLALTVLENPKTA